MSTLLRKTVEIAVLVAACLAAHAPAQAQVAYQCSADRQWAFNKCLYWADWHYQRCMRTRPLAVRCRVMRTREQRSCHKTYCTTTAPVRRTR